MSDAKQVDLILTELGAMMAIDSINKHDEDSWSIQFEDNKLVELFYTSSQHKLTLQYHIGIPTLSEINKLHNLLLEYNLSWPESGGVQMALNKSDGSVIQLFQLFTQDLSVQVMIDVLTNFIERADIWQGIIHDQGLFNQVASVKSTNKNNRFQSQLLV
ncbi:type III secretion system chaperone [Shewanella surugensis]|uniref:Type III secretion system chaperone n=1 Tax=Shewanella surugensis TaxID=212020 RepID=A0ABT0LIS6_9GAMM|nr:type III secretion system chaperone [Shewanella surugensis]MCL1127589.1 type III secretion system chaperone [Shewanella surugensis]